MDYIIKALAKDGEIRGYAAITTDLVNELGRIHQVYPTALAALGRLATAGAMLGAMLKGEERLTVQVKGGGPVGRLIVDADACGNVRGYIQNPKVHLPPKQPGKLDVGNAVGQDGYLTVIKDLGLKKPYEGSVPLVSGELADDLAAYFNKSEQIPSGVGLGVLVNPDGTVKVAGGFIIQTMPGLTDEEITELEQGMQSVKSVTEILRRKVSPEGLLEQIYPQRFKFLEKIPVQFRCRCSKEKLAEALISLGKNELGMLIEEGRAEITCNFCMTKYFFDKDELIMLLKELNMKEGKE